MFNVNTISLSKVKGVVKTVSGFIFSMKCVLLWILASITFIESTFEGDLLIASMNRRNDYNGENLDQCFYGHLTVLRQIVNLSLTVS